MRIGDLYQHVGGRGIPYVGASVGLSVLAVDVAQQPRPMAVAALVITSLGYLAKLAIDLNIVTKIFRSHNSVQDATLEDLQQQNADLRSRVEKLETRK